MGILLGLMFGLGLVLIIHSFLKPSTTKAPSGPSLYERLDDLLAQAGIEAVTPGQLLSVCVGVGTFVFLVMFVVSGAAPVALAFGVIAGYGPLSLVRYRARSRRQELRELWPDVVDNLASSVRAGLSLPEALSQIAVRGPQPLRRPFQRFAEDYRATGRFNECLDQLKRNLADPVGDRIVESLRIAREVGGSDLGRLLRTLSSFLREDVRTRAELQARQSWTVNAARLAVAAPWLVLGFMSFQREIIARYNSALGFAVLVTGAVVCVIAYRLMLRIGRLPEEERVLR
ncbi:type II secretion system F family protein [Thermasporomyces composti]|jgi:tight adherence protein B|uniref:Tight adherence protein B n=1 Tax=Thermasporomyces composti TaxID=696763 RepID=A0A3D9V8F4_THECX|nr:type II secretion system F family protein [Thermasporomyces composti]REF37576.1 tight adherence protein B [Thermasporomyces composti]